MVVNVDLPNEIDDDDDTIRESIKQGMRDILRGDVLTEEEFWKAVANDTSDQRIAAGGLNRQLEKPNDPLKGSSR